MSGYEGNGELFLGSFKTIRAFRDLSPPGWGQASPPGWWRAINYNDVYIPGKEYVAECKKAGLRTIHLDREEKLKYCILKSEEAPDKDCTCGFYSFYDIPTMLAKGATYIPVPSEFYYGVIENYGRVIHCDFGLRSEKMKILEVVPYSEIDDLVKRIPLDVFDASAYPSLPPES